MATSEQAARASPRASLTRGHLGAALEVWRYRELLRHLVGRELKVKYKRSALGWLWSLANPLMLAGVFTLVFSIFFRAAAPVGSPSGLASYPLFVLTGLLAWSFTSNVLSHSTASIVAGADLVKKVYFPRAVLVLSQVIALVVGFLLELAVLLVLVVASGTRPWGALVVLPVLLLLQTAFVAGLGLLTAALNVFFRDLQHLLTILLTMWFYATPIIYPPSMIPENVTVSGFAIPLGTVMRGNPMAVFVGAYRSLFYDGRLPPADHLAYLAVISAAILAISFVVFRRLEPRFAEEV